MKKNRLRAGKSKTVKKKTTEEYGLGGLIGTGLGVVAGGFLGNPMLGAKIGGTIGSGVDGVIQNKKYEELLKNKGSNNQPMVTSRASGSLGLLETGGFLPIGQDAVKVVGPSHAKGGVPIGEDAEVEGEETMDSIEGNEYVFSKKLKVPGSDKSFAETHEELVANNATEDEIKALAEVQEEVSGRSNKKGLNKYKRGN